FAQDFEGNRLKVRPANQATGRSITQGVLDKFLLTEQPTSVQQFPAFLGGDTELLLNFEYRIPIVGPLQFVPFVDVGSAFNLRKLENQAESSEFIQGAPLGSIILNPQGLEATEKELRKATTPETPAGSLPSGFTFVTIKGEQKQSQVGLFSRASNGLLDNYRASLGGELRIQVPVINVPFRLIFAYNPNARTDNLFFIEKKKTIRLSV